VAAAPENALVDETLAAAAESEDSAAGTADAGNKTSAEDGSGCCSSVATLPEP